MYSINFIQAASTKSAMLNNKNSLISDLKKHKKQSQRFLIQMFALVIMLLFPAILTAQEGVDVISTNNYANLSLEYYYYIPAQASKTPFVSYPLMVMVPGLSGQGSVLVNQEFCEAAKRYGIDAKYKEYNPGQDMVPDQFHDSLDFFAYYRRPGKINVTNKGKHEKVAPAAAIIPEASSGEVIVPLINGQKTRGRIKSETDKKVVLDIDLGRTRGPLSMSCSEIKRIEKVEN